MQPRDYQQEAVDVLSEAIDTDWGSNETTH
jgi:hypothetical protein